MPSDVIYLFVSSGESVVLLTVSPSMLWCTELNMFIVCVCIFVYCMIHLCSFQSLIVYSLHTFYTFCFFDDLFVSTPN